MADAWSFAYLWFHKTWELLSNRVPTSFSKSTIIIIVVVVVVVARWDCICGNANYIELSGRNRSIRRQIVPLCPHRPHGLFWKRTRASTVPSSLSYYHISEVGSSTELVHRTGNGASITIWSLEAPRWNHDTFDELFHLSSHTTAILLSHCWMHSSRFFCGNLNSRQWPSVRARTHSTSFEYQLPRRENWHSCRSALQAIGNWVRNLNTRRLRDYQDNECDISVHSTLVTQKNLALLSLLEFLYQIAGPC